MAFENAHGLTGGSESRVRLGPGCGTKLLAPQIADRDGEIVTHQRLRRQLRMIVVMADIPEKKRVFRSIPEFGGLLQGLCVFGRPPRVEMAPVAAAKTRA